MIPEKKTFLNEDEKLKLRLNRTYTERFRILMRLIKTSQKLRKAQILPSKP